MKLGFSAACLKPKPLHQIASRESMTMSLLWSSRMEINAWKKVVSDFEKPSAWRASWQLVSTLSCYLATWAAIYFAKEVSYLLVLPLALLASGFLVRLFIIFHDCCHNSFYKNSVINQWIGFFTGVLAFTPFKPLAMGTFSPSCDCRRP